MVFDRNSEHDACGVGQEVDLRALARLRHGVNHASLQKAQNVVDVIRALLCNQHRIGKSPDGTGDGSGVSFDIPVEYYNQVMRKLGVEKSYEFGEFGIIQLLLPRNIESFDKGNLRGVSFEQHIQELIKLDSRFKYLAVRDNPIDRTKISEHAQDTLPRMKQMFFSFGDEVPEADRYNLCTELMTKIDSYFYEHNKKTKEECDRVNVLSCSNEMITLKGMLNTDEIEQFYIEVQSAFNAIWAIEHPGEPLPHVPEEGITAVFGAILGIFHGRMSTNSFPQWAFPHPYGSHGNIALNGEINTIRSNRENRKALYAEIYKIAAMINADNGADSRHFAAHSSELMMQGLGLAESIITLLPAAYEHDTAMTEDAKAMLKLNGLITMPNTGPTHAVFTSIKEQGAALDPSGLRPSRVILTISKIADGDELGHKIAAENKAKGEWPYTDIPDGWEIAKMYVGSEDMYADADLAKKGEYVIMRDILGAGDMFLHKDGKFYRGKEFLEELANPAKNGGTDYKIAVQEVIKQKEKAEKEYMKGYKPQDANLDMFTRMQMLLWHQESIDEVLTPMIAGGKLPISAMGDDGQSLRFKHPTHLADFFKEQFAQITNPPLDFLREAESFSFKTWIGPNPARYYGFNKDAKKWEKKEDAPENIFLEFDNPFLMDTQLNEVKDRLKTKTIDITFEFDANDKVKSMELYDNAMKRITAEAEAAAKEGYMIVLSDRNISTSRMAISDVQAVAAVDGHLKQTLCRTNTSIIVESGQIKDTHHAAMLFAFGATAVNNYMIYELMDHMHKTQPLPVKGMSVEDMIYSFQKASVQTYGKIIAKNGYSTHLNYTGARMVEGRGLNTKDFGGAFEGVYSPMDGYTQKDIAYANWAAHSNSMDRMKDFTAIEKLALNALRASYTTRTSNDFAGLFNALGVDNANDAMLFILRANGNRSASKVFLPKLLNNTGSDAGTAFTTLLNLGDKPLTALLHKLQLRSRTIQEADMQHIITQGGFTDINNLLEELCNFAHAQNVEAQFGQRKLYGEFMKRADALKVAAAKEGKAPNSVSALIAAMVADVRGIRVPDERGVVLEAVKKSLQGPALIKAIDIIDRTIVPGQDVVNQGIYGMSPDGVPHRFGNELVAATNIMYAEAEAVREIETAKALAEERARIRDVHTNKNIRQALDIYRSQLVSASIDSNVAEAEIERLVTERWDDLTNALWTSKEKEDYVKLETQLRLFVHLPRNPDGTITTEALNNYKKPSKGYVDLQAKTKALRLKHFYSERDFVSVAPSPDRTALEDKDMKVTVSDLLKRTRAGQISRGAITPSAHDTIALAYNNTGGRSAAGEGSQKTQNLGTTKTAEEDQVASNRFGVTPEALYSLIDRNGVIQIKIVQGAKPGEGGELAPGKVVQWVATLRQSTPGVGLPSPAPMHDIYSIEDLQELIYDIKSAALKSPDGRIRNLKIDVKIASAESTEIVGIGAAKAGADIITVAGHEGGTGAAGILSARNTGLEGVHELANLHNGLKRQGLRPGLQLVYEGALATFEDAVLAYKYADTIGQGTFVMIANQCIMARLCNHGGVSEEALAKYAKAYDQSNPGQRFFELPQDELAKHVKEMMKLVSGGYCPSGVANSEVLFDSQPWRIEQIRLDFAAAFYSYLKEHGYDSVEAFQLDNNLVTTQPREKFTDLNCDFNFDGYLRNDPVTIRKVKDPEAAARNSERMDDQWMDQVNDWIAKAEAIYKRIQAGETGLKYPAPIVIEDEVNPYKRSVGTRTSSICLHVHDGRIKMEAYPDRITVGETDVVHIKLKGNAGQSFGFLQAWGMHLEANVVQDGAFKSGAGGVGVVKPDIPEGHPCPEVYRQNCVIGGNAIAYGNQGTHIFIAGKIGTRAGVCMKGGVLVCEGCKDYGAEYMTNGTFVSLGTVGNYFANAQTGGLSLVYDEDRSIRDHKMNKNDVREAAGEELFALQDALYETILKHYKYTESPRAGYIIENWAIEKNNFAYLVPKAYDRFQTQDQIDIIRAVDRDRKTHLSPGEEATRFNMVATSLRRDLKRHAEILGDLNQARMLMAEEPDLVISLNNRINNSEGQPVMPMLDAQFAPYMGTEEEMPIKDVIAAILKESVKARIGRDREDDYSRLANARHTRTGDAHLKILEERAAAKEAETQVA